LQKLPIKETSMTLCRIASVLAACGALISFSGVASAQSDTVTEKGGPSRAMLFSGLGTFGISYGAAAVVAATSDLGSDRRMFVPIAGPWMALGGRGGCGVGTPRTCDAATTDKVLIITDGVFQALGALLIVESFLNPETVTTTRASAAPPRLQVAPTFGANGYGLAAFGNF
jgi:hypothetical protein